jgi:hypothetical protein
MTIGTIANIGTIPDILIDLAKKVGENKNLSIGYNAEVSTRKGGEWEFDAYPRRSGNVSDNAFVCSLELTYWLASDGCVNDKSDLILSFPLNNEAKKKVINEISAMIDRVKLKVQAQTE